MFRLRALRLERENFVVQRLTGVARCSLPGGVGWRTHRGRSKGDKVEVLFTIVSHSSVMRRLVAANIAKLSSLIRTTLGTGRGAGHGPCERVKKRFDLRSQRLAGDTAYGAVRLLKWLIDHRISPHIPVWDRSARSDGTFSRTDFTFDRERNIYICPGCAELTSTLQCRPGSLRLHRANKKGCSGGALKRGPQMRPQAMDLATDMLACRRRDCSKCPASLVEVGSLVTEESIPPVRPAQRSARPSRPPGARGFSARQHVRCASLRQRARLDLLPGANGLSPRPLGDVANTKHALKNRHWRLGRRLNLVSQPAAGHGFCPPISRVLMP
jgi:hypothetical protein